MRLRRCTNIITRTCEAHAEGDGLAHRKYLLPRNSYFPGSTLFPWLFPGAEPGVFPRKGKGQPSFRSMSVMMSLLARFRADTRAVEVICRSVSTSEMAGGMLCQP